MLIRTIGWMFLIPITVLGLMIGLGYDPLDAGSSVQSLTTDSSGKIIAHQRDGESTAVMSESGGSFTSDEALTYKRDAVNAPILKVKNNADPNVAIADYPYAGLIIENVKDAGNALQFKSDDNGFTQIIFGADGLQLPVMLSVSHGAAGLGDENFAVVMNNNSDAPLKVTAQESGIVHVKVSTQGTCEDAGNGGNVCSQSVATTAAVATNCATGSTCSGNSDANMNFSRVGNMVHFSGQVSVTVCASSGSFSLGLDVADTDIPVAFRRSGNFSNFHEGMGTFAPSNSKPELTAGAVIAGAGGTELDFSGSCSAASSQGVSIYFTGQYFVQ